MVHFGKALERAREASSSFALLHIDLDNFKAINDSLGSSTGDGLLKGVAKRLESWLRDSNIASISGVEIEDMEIAQQLSLGALAAKHKHATADNTGLCALDRRWESDGSSNDQQYHTRTRQNVFHYPTKHK